MGTRKTEVVGYVRVSTRDQGDSGAGLDAQRDAITRAVEYRGWNLLRIYEDVASGSSMDKRPQLAEALAAIERGEASTLVVAKLDRLSRSAVDFGTLLERATKGGWNVVILDLGVDLSTPAGEMVATVMAAVAQWERRQISQRTREGLAAKKRMGVKLGRPSRLTLDTLGTLRTLHASGMGYRAIATELNRLSVPTSQGGKRWHASTVKAILSKDEPDEP